MLTHRKMSSPKNISLENAVQEETTSIASPTDLQYTPDNSNSALTVAKVSLTCNYGDLPSWMKDNRDILRGYRIPTSSYVKCVKSLFYFHNETVNIWSHLFGAIAFIFLGFTTYFYVLAHQPNARHWDFLVFYIFLLGAMVCLGLSSTFHTLCCHSEKVCANWNRCDYIGIVTLIVGSFYPMVYYGFYCNSVLQISYLSMISIFGTATITVAVSSKFREPQYRWFRTSIFLAMGLSAFVPLVHAIIIYGVRLSFDVISLKWLLLMGAFYVVGAVIYGTRVPERWYPGMFDLIGSSHQIFHIFVVVAALMHYFGVIQAMSFWHEVNHDCQGDIKIMKPKTYL